MGETVGVGDAVPVRGLMPAESRMRLVAVVAVGVGIGLASLGAGPDSRCALTRSRRWSMTSAFPTVAGRASAIRQHVLEMPAPVVADALGYHHVTTAKLAAQAGATWSRPPEITYGHRRAGPHGEPTTVDYATSPVGEAQWHSRA